MVLNYMLQINSIYIPYLGIIRGIEFNDFHHITYSCSCKTLILLLIL
jgi:hypothetical protein